MKKKFNPNRLVPFVRKGNDPPRKIPIQAKITAPYFFLALLLSVAAAFLITNIVFDTVEERFNNQLGELGQLSSELMVKEEDRLLAVFRLLANSEGLADTLAENNPEKLRLLSFGIVTNERIEAAEFLDLVGNPVLSMRHRRGNVLEDYDFSTGGDGSVYRVWDFVEKALKNQEDPLGDKFSGFAQADWGNYFYVSGPVYDQENRFVGMILVGTSLETLAANIHEKSLGQITFYEFSGSPIASSFISMPVPLDNETASRIIEDQDLQRSKIRNIQDQRDISVVDINYTEVLAPWEVRGDADLGILGAALLKNFYVNPTALTRVEIVFLIGVALFVIIMVGINLANLITRPLLGLVKASEAVSGGDLDVHVDFETNDEINVLIKSFNQMIVSLNQSKSDLLQAYDSALFGWSKALELRDKDTEGHTKRVTDMTVALARKIGFTDEDLVNIRRGAILHDIGKMGIPDTILHKTGRLNDEDWAVMRKHPAYAFDMLKDIRFLEPALDIPRYHHENWDGKGYPYGLKGEEIPLSARIFTVVDTWDALRSERPYKSSLSKEESLQILNEDAGRKYDPNIVESFKKFIEEFEA